MKILVVFLNRRSKTRNFLVVNRRSEKKKIVGLGLSSLRFCLAKSYFCDPKMFALNHGQGGKSISNLEVGMIFSCIPEWYMFQKNACFFQSWTTVENVFCGVFRPLKHNPPKKNNKKTESNGGSPVQTVKFSCSIQNPSPSAFGKFPFHPPLFG